MSPKPRKAEAKLGTATPEVRDLVRPWLLAGLVAVYVARPLVPSEGVAWLGDGHGLTLVLLLLSAAYLFVVGSRRSLLRQFDLVDGAVLALILAFVCSSLVGLAASRFGASETLEFGRRLTSPRLVVNMVWEWLGLGLIYFLTRQLVAHRVEARGLVVVMIALAVVTSVLGLYQAAVILPEQRAAYAENPDEVLQSLGQWFPPDSPERTRFEARLASTEPLATFALTNSLAGFLVAWLVVALGVAWGIVRKRHVSASAAARYAGLAVALGAMLVCLMLTQSRSAYVALAVGLVLLPLVVRDGRYGIPCRWIAAAGVALLVIVVAASMLGGLDETLLSQAQKSLGYRFEYWESTLDMIADFPLFGVGPGEFQNYYTQYKLPQASEEISDPHNFVLEVWATGGTLALLALVALLAAFAWQSWTLVELDESEPHDDALASRDSMRLMFLGAIAGLVVAYVLGRPFGFFLPFEQIVAALIVGGCVIGIFSVWLWRGTLPARLPALGVLVLSIHWLASGGFAFPGVADTFWLLLALGVNQKSNTISAANPSPHGWRNLALPLGLSVAVLALAVGCYYTAFLPVMACRAAMGLATDMRMSDAVRFDAMLGAIAADRLSAEPWMASAQLSAQRLSENPKSELWRERLFLSASSVRAVQGHSSSAMRELGRLFRQVYEVSPDKQIAAQFVAYTRLAAHWYPNSAVIQGEYAQALEMTGSIQTARRVAAKALELDRRTPHADKKLPLAMRSELENLAKTSESP